MQEKLCKNPLVCSINRNTEKYSFLNTTFKFQFGLLKNNCFMQNIPKDLFFKLYQYFYFKDNWVENKLTSYKLYKSKDNEIIIDKYGFKKNTKKIYYTQEDFTKNLEKKNDIMNYSNQIPNNIRFSIYKECDVIFENLDKLNEKDIIYVIPNDFNYESKNIEDAIFTYNEMLSFVFRHFKDNNGNDIYSIFLLVKILPTKLDSNIDTLNACLNIPSANLIHSFFNEINLVIDYNFNEITRDIVNEISKKAEEINENIFANNDNYTLYEYKSIKTYDFHYNPKTNYVLGFYDLEENQLHKKTYESNNKHYSKQNSSQQFKQKNNYYKNQTNEQRRNNYQKTNGNNYYKERSNNYQKQNNNHQFHKKNNDNYRNNQSYHQKNDTYKKFGIVSI